MFKYEIQLLHDRDKITIVESLRELAVLENRLFGSPSQNTLTAIRSITEYQADWRRRQESNVRIREMKARIAAKKLKE